MIHTCGICDGSTTKTLNENNEIENQKLLQHFRKIRCADIYL